MTIRVFFSPFNSSLEHFEDFLVKNMSIKSNQIYFKCQITTSCLKALYMYGREETRQIPEKEKEIQISPP